MALGPENFSIEEVHYYVDGNEVFGSGPDIVVDPAVSSSIRVRYRVRNEGASIFQWWDCCVTIWDVTHNQAVGSYRDHGIGGVSDWKDRTIQVGAISEQTTFRVRIWGTQDYNASPAYPPQGEW